MHDSFKQRSVSRSSWLFGSLLLASIALFVVVLYLAREILIPIALALLLTFVLAPIVSLLRRRGLGRTSSVIVTVVLSFALVGAVGGMLILEFQALASDLPRYRQNIREKIVDLRLVSKGGALEEVQETFREVMREFKKQEAPAPSPAGVVPVIVTGDQTPDLPGMTVVVGPLVRPLVSAGLVVVLVIFMLLRREDLRARLLRLAGYGRLAATTKAIDEAGKRVSKYLLRQFLTNSGFGLAMGLGLWLIGLPYPLVWGVLAGAARFVPYVGPWFGALGPIALSLAAFDGWTMPLIVAGLVLALELIENLVVEPMLYSQSIGVSEVALLVMLAFWTWLWGPIGLVLAAPMTVCLMVLAKSIPDLEFIGLLLGSEPVLAPHQLFYQRLVANDQDEAQEIVETFLNDQSRADLFEQVLIPALLAARHDHSRERLTDEERARLFRNIRHFIEVDELGEEVSPAPASEVHGMRPLMLGCPAYDEADEMALLMLAELLRAEQWPASVLSAPMPSAEMIAEVEKAQPTVVCIGFLPGSPMFPLRQFCKRLRARFPDRPIVVARWGAQDLEPMRQRLSGLVSDLGSSLAETKNQVIQFGQTSPSEDAPRAQRRLPPAGKLVAVET